MLQWQSERNGIKLDTLKYKIWRKFYRVIKKCMPEQPDCTNQCQLMTSHIITYNVILENSDITTRP